MKKAALIRGLYNITPNYQGAVIAIGNFDGVHKGHQALLAEAKKQAKKYQVAAAVLIFEPHGAEFFLKEKAAPRLMRLREKYAAFVNEGVDQVHVLKFNEQFSQLSAKEFIQEVLIKKLKVTAVVIGEDFHFGKNRQGDVALLQQYAEFKTYVISPVLIGGERVSSSRVREALRVGNQEKVQQLLNRSYTLRGRVAHGDKRGRILGFPTANIYLHRPTTPVQGVYVVRMHGISDRGLPGVANVGMRPTVGGTRTLLEVHLFDFNQTIYGKQVCVEFCHKLRDEKRFESFDLLKEQIFKDANEAREYFKKLGEV